MAAMSCLGRLREGEERLAGGLSGLGHRRSASPFLPPLFFSFLHLDDLSADWICPALPDMRWQGGAHGVLDRILLNIFVCVCVGRCVGVHSACVLPGLCRLHGCEFFGCCLGAGLLPSRVLLPLPHPPLLLVSGRCGTPIFTTVKPLDGCGALLPAGERLWVGRNRKSRHPQLRA